MSGSSFPVCHLADLPPGSLRRVDVGGARICLARSADGGVYAIDDLCTHEQEPLSQGELNGFEVECPGHFSRFDIRTGEVVESPAEEPTRTYAVTVVGDEVQIDVQLS